MDAVIYIAAALAALCAVLLVIVIMKLGRLSAGDGQIKELESKISSLEGQLRDEFERSRRESAGNQKDMRSELTESLDKMNERLALMTEANFKHQQQLTDMFSKSLDTIRRNNIEQNDRQSRIIAESIEKMQQSNEKKLDEMRATVDEKLSATLTTRLDSSFKTVSEQLENVYKSLGEMKELSTGVTTNVTNLNRVLTNVKARGTWAEVQLEGILDQTIPNMYVKTSPPARAAASASSLPYASPPETAERTHISPLTRSSPWRTMCACAPQPTARTPTRLPRRARLLRTECWARQSSSQNI